VADASQKEEEVFPFVGEGRAPLRRWWSLLVEGGSGGGGLRVKAAVEVAFPPGIFFS